jgi:hypothetical protein
MYLWLKKLQDLPHAIKKVAGATEEKEEKEMIYLSEGN